MDLNKGTRGGRRPGAGRKKFGRQTLSLTLHPSLIERLDRVTDNRSRYIAELLERELPPLDAGGKS